MPQEDQSLDELATLRVLVEGTAMETGEGFFAALVDKLQAAMGTMGAWVAVYDASTRSMKALAMKMRGEWMVEYRYRIEGTPCETVLDERQLLHIPDRLVELYDGDPALREYGPVSYLGVPLLDVDQKVIGHLAILHDKPLPEDPRATAIFRLFAERAAAELRRTERDRAIRERETQLSRLLASAMDAIVTFDDDFTVSLVNTAAERTFECERSELEGRDFRAFLDAESRARLTGCRAELLARESETASLWVAGGLKATTSRGRAFHAEATFAHYAADGRRWFTLILRDVEERFAAERRIEALASEAAGLRAELRSFHAFEPIIGSSAALMEALRAVESVARADTTVLLLGETGTGKELFARAIHVGSDRREKPLIKVDCGSIPSELIESELFGHEKGAFTGATARREGRFALADGGTVFLDEIGELPIELQPKLLRVLQEGEFTPVGSSRTLKVNVRVVAATNRDLAQRVRERAFREDLYYRLNVFPIRVPPLRERGDDVVELARAFVARFSRRMGRSLGPLSDATLARLRAYPWPGNVRELANVLERGVILSDRGVFDVDRALADSVAHAERAVPAPSLPDPSRILTVAELEQFERTNIVRALDATTWKVAGERGAGALLGMHPSTLSSRMRVLGIRRPVRD